MIEIALARPSEAAQCRAVLSAAFVGYIRALGRTDPPLATADLPEALSEGRAIVARDQTQVVGLLIFSDTPSVRTLDSIAVAPDRQGQGIGSALIRAVESAARARGLTSLELCTAEIMEDRVRLYQSLGFHTYRRALPPHGRDSCPRVFMRKVLTEGRA